MGRLPQLWGEDAAVFRPERWLGDGDKKPRQTPFAWLAFLAGERSCVGQRFAMLEMKSVLATLLTRFELLELPGAAPPREERQKGTSSIARACCGKEGPRLEIL